ncbi:MAG TPA: antibiotic biosynthesis monooxygenase [Sphingopyxis sp.]|jgi:heme-degrading monooxygenase HmoA|uniref:antibiotic biosynthesis monooxygenase family protein n=1 Tax=Sphingopyxis sp. TaxID=1908224 RepID=UPI002E0F5A88|nr:antibiotic biosynthesis monooxygenase [Sphingopyxis sp.]
MIVEHALLQVRAGEGAAFERALAQARPLIAASPGFLGMEVRRGCEAVETYLLIVHWDRMEDHRDGFRRSDRYNEWRTLLHPFYDPMPVVQYFGEPV